MNGERITKTGLFPGRFQPFTNAHLERLIAIRNAYSTIRIVVVLGDVGCLNRENFLHINERKEMIEQVCSKHRITNTAVIPVAGAHPPCRWVRNVLNAVPDADIVFSDNPFVYQPFRNAGLEVVVHHRTGPESSGLRDAPFSSWQDLVPQEVFEYMQSRNLYERMLGLPATGRYPFLKGKTQGDRG